MKYLAEMTFVEVQEMGEGALLILPVGAIEAHGPHLPLQTDVTIARGMAAAGAALLEQRGVKPVVIGPAVQFTAAGFAAGFAGTVSLKPETVTALLSDALRGFHRSGFSRIALANAHLDPAHIASLHEAVRIAGETRGLTLIFPDITRKPWALRLTEEFKSGACHAGRFETSLLMAARPDTVRESIRLALSPNPRSLSRAIKEGKKSFEEAGGQDAYFGFPAEASVDEGRETLSVLAAILADAVTGDGDASKQP